MKNILIVFGTRPEAIKMAPLVKEFKKHECFNLKVCVTAQHREMLDQVLKAFDIKPEFDLNLMQPGQDLYDITSKVLLGIRNVLKEFRPELVLVHGDTTTSFAATLASFYQKIPVAHVEAGLRTGDIYSPWPEEANRKLTSQLAKFHFAPTIESKDNLVRENISEKNILITGNTVIDSLFLILNKISNSPEIQEKLISKINLKCIKQQNKEVNSNAIILVTGHRRENFGNGFLQICEALKTLAIANPSCDIIYPVHLNPNARKPVYEILDSLPNVHLIEPLDYEPFVFLMSKVDIIITDSGGIQEEAPSLGKPVLVMRDTTERPEAVASGIVKLVGANKENIVREVQFLIDDKLAYQKMVNANNPYGDGKACERIVQFLKG
jgi:UDP-N-acetylglucosamine 2-epimerase (non-hydrolysing)